MREIKQDRNHNRHKKKIAALLGIFCVGAVLFSGCAGVGDVQKGNTRSLPQVIVGSDDYPPFNFEDAGSIQLSGCKNDSDHCHDSQCLRRRCETMHGSGNECAPFQTAGDEKGCGNHCRILRINGVTSFTFTVK